MTNFAAYSLTELGRMLRAGKVSSVEITEATLARIGRIDPSVHAFIRVTPERALQDAVRADAELAKGQDRGPLHGIPFGMKDIYDTAGITTTCHSRLLIDNVPKADSAVAERFAQAGAVLLGKLATNEFAFGGPGFDLPFPVALNPWNRDRYTGGSSAGSAAAIIAGFMRFSPGSDTGGSIRGPAAWCGTVGIKPTYGRVSRRGVFPLSWTLDHCGPLGRRVEDTAIALQVMAGHDPQDPGSLDVEVPDYLAEMQRPVAGMRIGVPYDWFAKAPHADPEVLSGIALAIEVLQAAGAVIEPVELPDFALFGAVARVLLTGEGFAVHRQMAMTRLTDYAEVNVGRLIVGSTISGAQIIDAQRVRRILVDAMNAVLRRVDAIVTATVLQTAPPLHDTGNPMGSASPMQTTPANATGHPALSLPVKLASNGLPTAVQIIGRPFDEGRVLAIAHAMEARLPWQDVALPDLG
jgi:aspartyl-tRNA(Asn)/glutamyl-tRNA(Gln) amidotransferase subunit A